MRSPLQALFFTHTEQLMDYLITYMTFLQQTCVSRKRMWENTMAAMSQLIVYRKYVLYIFCCGRCHSKMPRNLGFAAVAVHVVSVVYAFALGRTSESIFRFHLHVDLHAFCLMSPVHKRQLLVSTPSRLNTLHLYCHQFTLPSANINFLQQIVKWPDEIPTY